MARALNNLSVSKIKANLLNVAQSSLYKLTLTVPPAVSSKFSQYNLDDISLLCSEATLPGSSLNTHEVTNDYHGVTEKMAYRRMYDETVGLTFYVDRNYKVIELLEGWMDYISGVDNKKTYEGPYASYRMSYPNTYKNNIYLTKFEKDQFTRDFSNTRGDSKTTSRSLIEYTFVQAWPLSLTAIPVSYDNSSVLKCNVSFNFIRYVMNKPTALVSSDGIVNSDPTLGAPDLIGTTANFA